jgi:hypothetical protein
VQKGGLGHEACRALTQGALRKSLGPVAGSTQCHNVPASDSGLLQELLQKRTRKHKRATWAERGRSPPTDGRPPGSRYAPEPVALERARASGLDPLSNPRAGR